MSEKYLNLNLEDENAQLVAEILANKTAKKMLSLIAEKDDLSQTDIANKLGLGLNTVDYNIKKLLASGLIEKSKTFFWSVRGKRIETYRLANKKIIISTKSRTTGFISTALIFGALGFLGNVASNIFRSYNEARGFFSSNIDLNSEGLDKVASSGVNSLENFVSDSSDAGNLISTNSGIDFTSLFHNAFLWVGVGIVVGVLGYYIYNKFFRYVKGGKNII